MVELLSQLSQAVEGSAGIALLAALVWGVLSVALSPCHLASIPLIVGFISGQREQSGRRAFTISLLFGSGILITVAVIGAVTAAMGRLMGDVGPIGNYIVAAVFLIVGLHMLDILPLPMPAPARVGIQRRGLLAALILGLVYGVALGPCTFAFMAPVLAVSFRTAADAPFFAAAMLALYGVGHSLFIVAAGTSASAAQRYLNWSGRGTAALKRVCGALVIAGGGYLIYIAR